MDTEFTDILIALEEAHFLADQYRQAHAVIQYGRGFKVLPADHAPRHLVVEVCR